MNGHMRFVFAFSAAVITLFNIVKPDDAVRGVDLFSILLMSAAAYVAGFVLENWLEERERRASHRRGT